MNTSLKIASFSVVGVGTKAVKMKQSGRPMLKSVARRF